MLGPGSQAAREQLDESSWRARATTSAPVFSRPPAPCACCPASTSTCSVTDRSAPLSGGDTAVIVPGGNGMFLSTVVVNGEVVGSWRRTQRPKKVQLEIEPLHDIPASARQRHRRSREALRRVRGAAGSPL